MNKSDAIAERRPAYLSDLAGGTDRFFHQRSEICPWCGSKKLGPRLRTTDILQHKPGNFRLDSCKECGHIFQNPRLNTVGLEFYYRDCYDGLGAEGMDVAFEGKESSYKGQVDMVSAVTTPTRWLDVGTGHGHFPQAAKAMLPETEFDGLDMTDGVKIAKQNGRIGQAYTGNFVDLAGELSGQYDVISMYHYLEHTTEPQREIAAAAEALPVGGHLAIELPDPECVWGRVLGRWWMPWLQPQHLSMIPIANLRKQLTEQGFTVLAEDRVEPHNPRNVAAALLLLVNAATIGGEDLAWRAAPPARHRRLARKIGFVAALPLFLAAWLVDWLTARIGPGRGLSTEYRVLARRTS